MTTNKNIVDIIAEKGLDGSICSLLSNEKFAGNSVEQLNSLVKELADAGANVNARCTRYEELVSHIAVIFGTPLEVIKTLADLGTDFSKADVYGSNACDDAIQMQYNEGTDVSLAKETEAFLVGNDYCQPTGVSNILGE